VSRRALTHRRPLQLPLPDALMQTATASVAVVAKLRSLDRGELEERLEPIVDRYEHTLLVLPSVGDHVAEWVDEQGGGRVTAVGYCRDPRTVSPPVLPHLAALEHTPADAHGTALEKLPDGVQFLRHREALLEEARRDNAASRRRRSWPLNDRSRI
jgi:hypothetical protein